MHIVLLKEKTEKNSNNKHYNHKLSVFHRNGTPNVFYMYRSGDSTNATCEQLCDIYKELHTGEWKINIFRCYSGNVFGYGLNMDPVLKDYIPDEPDFQCDGILSFTYYFHFVFTSIL